MHHMHKPLILIVLLLSSSFTVLDVSSIDISIDETGEDKPRPQAINYIPFKEVATVIIDQNNDVTKVSYSLMSKDNKDFLIPDSLATKILNTEKILSIVYTNEEKCGPGVLDATCIVINVLADEVEGTGLKEKQKSVREIGDSVIDDINQVLGTNTKFHSTPIQTSANFSEEGAVISAVYTMDELPSKTLFAMFILSNIPDEIRFATGFFNHAYELSDDENSVFMFSIDPEKNRNLYTFNISVTSHDNKIDLNNFSPLDLLHKDSINRSKLYADGFYPLNSIVNVLVFSEYKLQVLKTNSDIIGSLSNANELKKNGWYFVSGESVSADGMNKLDLRYLFGNTNSVNREQLLLSINPVVEDVSTQISGWLPVGVKSPAPNFERALTIEWTIAELYREIGTPEKNYVYTWGVDLVKASGIASGLEFPDAPKIIKGDAAGLPEVAAVKYFDTELLVFSLHIGNNKDTPVTYYPHHSKMYDGKDRIFDPHINSAKVPENGKYANAADSSWGETCAADPVDIQPGVGQVLKLCFEIPKDSDHFKIVTLLPYAEDFFDVVAVFDRLGIGEDALPQQAEEMQQAEETNQGGGCLIATATFGSEMAPQVQFLRELRDNTVLQTESGSTFMTGFNQFYYSFSPTIADYERENPTFKEAVKLGLTPLLSSLTLLQYADIDSESEMLGYGIGVILLNIGMYFIAPAILVMKIRKLI